MRWSAWQSGRGDDLRAGRERRRDHRPARQSVAEAFDGSGFAQRREQLAELADALARDAEAGGDALAGPEQIGDHRHVAGPAASAASPKSRAGPPAIEDAPMRLRHLMDDADGALDAREIAAAPRGNARTLADRETSADRATTHALFLAAGRGTRSVMTSVKSQQEASLWCHVAIYSQVSRRAGVRLARRAAGAGAVRRTASSPGCANDGRGCLSGSASMRARR